MVTVAGAAVVDLVQRIPQVDRRGHRPIDRVAGHQLHQGIGRLGEAHAEGTHVIGIGLALPGQAADSHRLLKAIRDNFGANSWFSLMNQYTPPADTAMPLELARRLTTEEYEELIDFALSLGLENGFIQEAGTASEKFIPDFNLDGILHKGE